MAAMISLKELKQGLKTGQPKHSEKVKIITLFVEIYQHG